MDWKEYCNVFYQDFVGTSPYLANGTYECWGWLFCRDENGQLRGPYATAAPDPQIKIP
jgi:hypothetical protein